MDFWETFPIKTLLLKNLHIFLFDINQRHGQNGKSGDHLPPPVQIKLIPLNPI